jgi:benzoyl-CoA reductase/2-hydroxyglutaryl-CoA dehydratase subunit BcrC/BadD/HgdB
MNAIAYSSPFVPPEWIAAHGLRPRRLNPRLHAVQQFSAVARGVCPYAGALMNAVLSGSDGDALVLTTTCDQMRYAAAVLETRAAGPVFLLNVPSTWQTAAARELYRDELRRLGRFLAEVGGEPPTDAELAQILLDYDHARRDNSRELASWGDSCTVAPGVGSATAAPTSGTTPGVPLAVLGGPLTDGDESFADGTRRVRDTFFEIVERAGGHVVLDATEGGWRTLPRPFDPARTASDPFAELADAYFDAIPDAFRRPNNRLYEWLGRELAAHQVKGILFRRYVWCDLWHAELPRLREWSPVPVLEIDIGADDAGEPGRAQGRIEAFLEMLQDL